MPTVKGAYSDPAFQTDQVKVFQNILATTAAPLPAGTRGEPVRDAGRHRDEGSVRGRRQRQADHRSDIKAKLDGANQQVKAGG